MRRVNFYWIIAAFCILRMADLQTSKSAPISGQEEMTQKGFTFSMKDAAVSGRWMR